MSNKEAYEYKQSVSIFKWSPFFCMYIYIWTISEFKRLLRNLSLSRIWTFSQSNLWLKLSRCDYDHWFVLVTAIDMILCFLIRYVKTILRFKIVLGWLSYYYLMSLFVYKSLYHFVTFNFKRHVKMNWHDINPRNDLC